LFFELFICDIPDAVSVTNLIAVLPREIIMTCVEFAHAAVFPVLFL